MADLHVVEDLRQRQRGHAAQPRREEAGEQEPASGDLEPPLGFDHRPDVLGVAFAELGTCAVAQLVELAPEGVDLLGGQLWTFGGHGGSWSDFERDVSLGDRHA